MFPEKSCMLWVCECCHYTAIQEKKFIYIHMHYDKCNTVSNEHERQIFENRWLISLISSRQPIALCSTWFCCCISSGLLSSVTGRLFSWRHFYSFTEKHEPSIIKITWLPDQVTYFSSGFECCQSVKQVIFFFNHVKEEIWPWRKSYLL